MNLRLRFYSPVLNRFLQTDPIGFAGDALNLYRYCGDDPVDRTDPMGLLSDYVWDRQMWWQSGSHLSFDDWEQRRHPAGMDGGGGSGDGGGGATQALTVTGQPVRPNSRDPNGAGSDSIPNPDAPMRFVPTHLADDGTTVVPKVQT